MRHSTDSIDTLATHAGRSDFGALGVHAPPVDLSSTYPFPDLDQATAALDAFAAGAANAATPIYGRLYNPTVARFEHGLAALEGAHQAVAFASGMAAITAVLLAAGTRGRHVIAVRPLYGGTDHLLASGALGLEVTYVAAREVASALRSDTSLVLIETPGNPTLSLVDIADVVRQAGAVPVAVDSTFATPVLQRPLDLGAAYSIHSATKFLSGHGDVIAGVVACHEQNAAGLRQLRILTGALLHPWAAYLLHRSLPTLPLRVRRAQESASHLATRLANHPGVRRVLYPGLPGGDPLGLLGRQMSGPGAIVAFEVTGGAAAARQILQTVKLATPAVSLGSTDTLIEHPAGLTHRLVDPAALAAEGITPGLLRLSVGLEDPEDIWRDLETALLLAAEAPAERTQLAEAPLR